MANTTTVAMLLLHLQWQDVTIVSDDEDVTDALSLTQTLSEQGVQHVLVWGREALSGDWLYDVVKTGEVSWRPVHLLLMCSLPCVTAALAKATHLEQTLGTYTAFPMTSRWLLSLTGSDVTMDSIDVSNVTMDNVVFVGTDRSQTVRPSRRSACSQRYVVVIHSLQWTAHGRRWTVVSKVPPTPLVTAHPGHHTQSHTNKCAAADHCETFLTGGDLEGLLFPNTRHGFNGRRVRVLVKEWLSIVTLDHVNGSQVWSGMFMDYLKVASKALNFTYDLVDATDDEWGLGTPSDPDRGFLGYVARKDVDIGLSSYALSWERSILLETVWPLMFTPMVMAYRKPEVTEAYRMPLGPLGSTLAAGVAGALVLVSLLVWALEMWSWAGSLKTGDSARCSSHPKWWTRLLLLDKVFQLTGGAILAEPSERQVKSRSGGLLLWSWWLLSLVVTAAYSGTLTSFLSVNTQPLLFSTARDLLTKDHHYTWGAYNEDIFTITLQNSSDPLHQALWSGIQRFRDSDPTVLSVDVSIVIDKVHSQDFVFFIGKLDAIYMFPDDCDIVLQETRLLDYMLAPILPKGSALTRPLSDVALTLHANGLLSQWTDKWLSRTPCPAPSGPVVISLLHVQGVLLVLPVGVGVALGVMVVERVYHRTSRNRPDRQHTVTGGD